MNKAGLVDVVAAKTAVTKKVAEDAVDTIFESIMKELGQGEEVAIAGFGVFLVKKRSARMGINPRTGEKMHMPETKTPKFRAGKALKQAVK